MEPFIRAARAYFDSGWSPLPLPSRQKSPVPDKPNSFTGGSGEYVTKRQLDAWLAPRGRASAGNLNYPPGNIALRSPKDIVWIDVDAYGEKAGEATLAAAERAWGPLPPTWVSSSRSDGLSGLRPYRVPEGLAWPGELPQGKGVELIRWDHRYAIVAPSIHDKTGAEYAWYREELSSERGAERGPDGETFAAHVERLILVKCKEGDSFPDADDASIPPLPRSWVEGLTAGRKWEARAFTELTDEETLAWLRARPAAKPCSHMRKLLTKARTAIQKATDDGGVHESALEAVWGILNDAKAGHPGVIDVLASLRDSFVGWVTPRRPDEGAARKEWTRIVKNGVSKVIADASVASGDDPCEGAGGKGGSSAPKPRTEGGGRVGSDAIEPTNELGNANRLWRVCGGNARWVEAYGSWYLWSEQLGIWELDDTRQMDRWSVKAINQIDEEVGHLAGYENAEALAKAYRAHQKASLKVGAQSAMRELLKARKGIMVDAGSLDEDPRLLAVGNGVVLLGDDGPSLRPKMPEAYLTKSTPIAWRQGAYAESARRGGLWHLFLERFQPDEEVRGWLQRIVGYSLLGRNSRRHFMVLQGKTSTGKSTFAEAIRNVLGGHGGVMTASVFRDNADDRPRPDLLAAYSRRVIVAEEVGIAQHLSADQIKRVTGGDVPITARGMRSNTYITRVPSFTPWLVCNNAPRIEGADAALRRRTLVVPWRQIIAEGEEDTWFMSRLLAEDAESVLDWAVEGWARYVSDSDLSKPPAGAIGAADDFAADLNDFAAWLDARAEVGDGLYDSAQRLFEDWQGWCAEADVRERDRLNSTAFGRRLADYGFVRDRVYIDGKQTRVWQGIRLARIGSIS